MTALSALLAGIASAIATNSALETFCQTNFNKSINVYVHVDPNNPPSISKAPWVGLTVQGYERPAEDKAAFMNFSLETAVYCEKSGETTSGKITTLDGFSTIEALSNMVFAIIESAVTQSATVSTMDYLSEQETSIGIAVFPGWIAARTWKILNL